MEQYNLVIINEWGQIIAYMYVKSKKKHHEDRKIDAFYMDNKDTTLHIKH